MHVDGFLSQQHWVGPSVSRHQFAKIPTTRLVKFSLLLALLALLLAVVGRWELGGER